MKHRWRRLRFAAGVWLQEPSLYPVAPYPSFDVDLCVRMFNRNQEMLHGYARSIGAEAVTYLQPFNGFGARPKSQADEAGMSHMRRRVTTDGTSELDAIYAFYDRLTEGYRARCSDAFIDVTAVFDRAPTGIYIDQVHCSDVGYALIARRMAADILRREGVAAGDETS